jgi:hypothetical protein
VLASLSAKGWTIVYSTHSPEMVSFDEKQVIPSIGASLVQPISGEKVTPEISITKLSDLQWQTKHPQFKSALSEIATWIDPTLKT